MQNFEAVDQLIQAGCNLDLCDNDYHQSAIHCAIRLGEYDCVMHTTIEDFLQYSYAILW
jgi:ankyrin repeat protein